MKEEDKSTDFADDHRLMEQVNLRKSEKSADNDPETYLIIGAAMEVHRELGSGFLEAVYQEAICQELAWREVPFQPEVPLRIKYKNTVLESRYRADLICFEKIIVELKALSQWGGNEQSQLLNYLKATGLSRGLLINFGKSSLEWKRFVFDHTNSKNQRESAKSADGSSSHSSAPPRETPSFEDNP